MPPGTSFPRTAWVSLNHLPTDIGLFHTETHKCGMVSTAACERSAKGQTAEHVITSFPNYHLPIISLCRLRCQQKSCNLTNGNISDHLVDHPAPIYLPQTTKKLIVR